MLLLDLPRGEMESEEETATSGSSSVFVWRGGAVCFVFPRCLESNGGTVFLEGFGKKSGDF